MSTDSQPTPRRLPDRPNLRHLKDQAKDLLNADTAASLADAQFQIARLYGFASWPRLKVHVESFEEIGQLKQAIDTNDIAHVKNMMTRKPALHRAPLGLRQGWPAHVGRRMPRALGAAGCCEACHGGMDDPQRIGRAPGRRRAANASRAQCISYPDDGTSGCTPSGCERSVAWALPHHLCALRVHGPNGAEMASRSRGKSELSRPWVRDKRPLISGHGSRLPHCRLRAFRRNG